MSDNIVHDDRRDTIHGLYRAGIYPEPYKVNEYLYLREELRKQRELNAELMQLLQEYKQQIKNIEDRYRKSN